LEKVNLLNSKFRVQNLFALCGFATWRKTKDLKQHIIFAASVASLREKRRFEEFKMQKSKFKKDKTLRLGVKFNFQSRSTALAIIIGASMIKNYEFWIW
jgi:hypothetical protein